MTSADQIEEDQFIINWAKMKKHKESRESLKSLRRPKVNVKFSSEAVSNKGLVTKCLMLKWTKPLFHFWMLWLNFKAATIQTISLLTRFSTTKFKLPLRIVVTITSTKTHKANSWSLSLPLLELIVSNGTPDITSGCRFQKSFISVLSWKKSSLTKQKVLWTSDQI